MSNGGGISIISHYDNVKIGLFMDKITMEDPTVLMKILHRNFDELLGPKWREFKIHQDLKPI